MINLLPPDQKRQILAGRSNVLLLRYCVLSFILAVLLFLMAGGVYLLMSNSQNIAEKAIEESTQRSAAFQKIQNDADTFRQNLTTAKTILDKGVNYSSIAIKIAQTLPSNIVLNSLELDGASFGQPTTIYASGKTYDDALRLKSAFEQSDMFDDAHLESVSNTSSEEDNGYPIEIIISVTINSEEAKS